MQKKEHKPQENKEQKSEYKKMFLYFTIVSYGIGTNVIDILRECGSVAQFVSLANGTASKAILDILSIEDSRKDVVIAFVDETNVEDVARSIDRFIHSSKRNMGVGFSMPLTSLVGEKMYHFLTDTL